MDIDKNFMKGRVIINNETKEGNPNKGVIEKFYLASENNKSHAGQRLFSVRLIPTRQLRTWWYDNKALEINPNITILSQEESDNTRKY